MPPYVLGIDAAGTAGSKKKGWFGIGLLGGRLEGFYAPTVDELVTQAENLGRPACIAIDMPIGLPDKTTRAADVAASKRVGRRSSSVFPIAIRQAMEAATQPEADEISRELVHRGVGSTTFSLARRIGDVEAFVRSTDYRVVEVHPEVSFAELKGGPLEHAKHNWSGFVERRDLLEAVELLPGRGLGVVGDCASVDDILDACICAWTARRVATGQAYCLPDPPEVFSDGLSAAIWV